jgi:hypothetical protein
MKKLSGQICVLGVSLIITAAHADDREWVSYKKLIDTTYLDKFYQVDPGKRQNLKLLIKVTPVNKSIAPSTVVLTTVHASGKDKLPLNSEGLMELVPDPAWIKEDAMIYTNLPKSEKSNVSAIFAVRLPELMTVSYKEMMAGVPEWNALIKEQAGLLRFMLPKFNAIEIHYAQPAKQTVQIMSKGGAKTLTADADGDIKLKLDEALQVENPQLVFSEKPTLIAVDEI